MKKFKQLWYTGIAIIGVPVAIIVMATFFAVASNIREKTPLIKEEIEQPKVDTVVVEKRVVVRDTVYIKSKPQVISVPTKDTL